MKEKKVKNNRKYREEVKTYTRKQLEVCKEAAKDHYKKCNGECSVRVLMRIAKVPESYIVKWMNEEDWSLLLSSPKDLDDAPDKLKDDIHLKAVELGLSEKEELFCHHYLRTYNITTAAMKAGYKSNTGYHIGHKLMTKERITNYLEYLHKERSAYLFMDGIEIIRQYMKIAFADITDYVSFSGGDVNFRHSSLVDGQIIAKVSSGKNGPTLELHDKMKALEKLEKYLGVMPDEWRKELEFRKLELMEGLGKDGKLVVNIVDDIK